MTLCMRLLSTTSLDKHIQTETIIKIFRPLSDLRKLVIKGIKHQDTLDKLKNGLVKDDGRLFSENV